MIRNSETRTFNYQTSGSCTKLNQSTVRNQKHRSQEQREERRRARENGERGHFKKRKSGGERVPALFPLSSFKGTGKGKKINKQKKGRKGNTPSVKMKSAYKAGVMESFWIRFLSFVEYLDVFTARQCFHVSPSHWISVAHC